MASTEVCSFSQNPFDQYDPQPVCDYYDPVEAQSWPELEEQSIFESFHIPNEVFRIRELSHLTPEQKRYYIDESLMSYFEEFAAKIRIKKLAGVIKDDGSLEILGTNVTQMYENAAAIAGPDSREDREREGLTHITRALAQGANRAIWISPPKVADYSFAFDFIRDAYDPSLGGYPFREILLRYDEPMGSLDKSRNVFNTLNDLSGQDNNADDFLEADDFLAHPIVYHHDGNEDLQLLNTILEISDQDIEKSERFRAELKPRIQPFMEEYHRLILRMSSERLPQADINELVSQCEMLVGAMFNTARIVSRTFDKTEEPQHIQDRAILNNLHRYRDDPEALFAMAAGLYEYQRLVITGGSNCPVTRGIGIPEQSFIESLQMGLPITDIMKSLGLPSETKKYKFDKEGLCRNPKCGKSHKEVGLLGPCLVCRGCQQEFDRKESIARMFRLFSSK